MKRNTPPTDEGPTAQKPTYTRFARVTRVLGALFVFTAIYIWLFAAYQLWGTSLQTLSYQQDLGHEFADMQSKLTTTSSSAPSSTSSSTLPTTATSTPDTEATPTTTPSTTPPTTAPTSYTKPTVQTTPPPPLQVGQPVGKIRIPAIGADFWVVQGVDLPSLEKGPGHYLNTPLPGYAGNAALAGHRTTYLAPFNRIDELNVGDEIIFEGLNYTARYKVMAQKDGAPHMIVYPQQTEVLQDKGDNRLTLTACHPKYSAAQRIVVSAQLVGDPVPGPSPTTPDPEANTPPPSSVLSPPDPSSPSTTLGSVTPEAPTVSSSSQDLVATSSTPWRLLPALLCYVLAALATLTIFRTWKTKRYLAIPLVLTVGLLFWLSFAQLIQAFNWS